MSLTPEIRSDDAQSGSLPASDLNAALVTTERPRRQGAVSSCLTFAWRRMLKVKHVPEQMIDVTVTPILLLVMFSYLFGGAIAGSVSVYLQFMAPGVLAMSVLFTTIYSGVTLNTDVTTGVVDRFRSLPIWQPSPLVGALLGDSVRYAIAAAVTITVALALGFRPQAGLTGVVLATLLLVLFAFGLSWVFTTVGLVMRNPNAVLNFGWTLVFPLVFVSNAFVDPATMPGWLETLVNVNPISFLISALRGLMEGNVDRGDLSVVLGTTVALTAVFAPLTSWLYRTRE